MSAVFTETMNPDTIAAFWNPLPGGGSRLIVDEDGNFVHRVHPNPTMLSRGHVADSFAVLPTADFSITLDWREQAFDHAGRMRFGLVLDFANGAGDAVPVSIQANIVSGSGGGAFQWVVREGDVTQRVLSPRSAAQGTLSVRFDLEGSTITFSDTADGSGETISLHTGGLDDLVVIPRIRGQWIDPPAVVLPGAIAMMDNFVIETGVLFHRPQLSVTALDDVGFTQGIEAGTDRTARFRVHNLGMHSTNLRALELVTQEVDVFTLVSDPFTVVAPGQSTDMMLRIAPGDHANRRFTADFYLRRAGDGLTHLRHVSATTRPVDDPDGPRMIVVGYNGNPGPFGEIIPHADLRPAVLDGTRFGAKRPDDTTTHHFGVYNASTFILNVTSIEVLGAPGFVVDVAPFSLAPRSARTLEAHFVTGTLGAHTATVRILSNDPDTPAYEFKIRGTVSDTPPALFVQGRAPEGTRWLGIDDADMSPRRKDGTAFGATPQGIPVSRVFRLAASMFANPSNIQVRIIGGDGAFIISQPLNRNNILPGIDAFFTIDFLAETPGLARARVEVSYGTTNPTVHAFDIKGTAI